MLILTAYHCIRPSPPALVRVGSSDWTTGGELHHINPRGLCGYPNNGTFLLHDIGVAGWGYTPHGWPRYLQETNIGTMDKRDCYSHGYAMPESYAFCTHTHVTSICKGDSGGAVMYKGVQVGLVSHLNRGNPNVNYQCRSDHPDTMVFVPAYLNWIRYYMRIYE
ncbi:hypothetical protein QAD02_018702 [Eretmocerus hayati]|uniref:Uncharacterized protein n=1 Tax=Eretmocerus hayati TaxID=131215 RepID=A0ACC2PHL4_9HYME|nr:hypothetical protein QAD02_018702 [Eretmocerus hayati]